MKITGLVVSVSFADLLAQSIGRWKSCDVLVVVTSPDDQHTRELCIDKGVNWYPTDAFTRDGAAFNKARAMVEAIQMLELLDEWMLFFDADIVPPADWRQQVEAANPKPGFLYGAPRVREDGRTIVDNELAGYFALAHASDPNMQRRPLLETHWRHAGNYDTEFQARWAATQRHRGLPDRRLELPIPMTHLGEVGTNWFGRGNIAAMQAMQIERQRRGGRYDHEKIH